MVSNRMLLRGKEIFYDTTGFEVTETRVYHLCRECAGYSEVVGEGLNQHVHGFSVPFNACKSCRQKARDSFAKTKKQSDTAVVLQDRVADIFEKK